MHHRKPPYQSSRTHVHVCMYVQVHVHVHVHVCVVYIFVYIFVCICAVCAACGACMWLPDCFHLHWSWFAANKLLLQNTCLIRVQQLSPINAAGGALVHQPHVPERSSSEPAATAPSDNPTSCRSTSSSMSRSLSQCMSTQQHICS